MVGPPNVRELGKNFSSPLQNKRGCGRREKGANATSKIFGYWKIVRESSSF